MRQAAERSPAASAVIPQGRRRDAPGFRSVLAAGVVLATLAALLLGPGRSGAPARAAGDPSQRGPRAFEKAEIAFESEGGRRELDLTWPTSGPPGPALILIPSGALGDAEHHVGQAEHLASWGMSVGVLKGFLIQEPGDIVAIAGRASRALDAMSAAPELAGRLDGRAAVVGLHYGAASALQAAVDDPRFRAVVAMHGAVFPLQSTRYAIRVPYLAMGGRAEGGIICPLPNTWPLLYSGSGETHKALYDFAGASAFDFQDPPFADAGFLCGNPSPSPPAWIKGLLTAWLQYYVQGDTSAYPWLYAAEGVAQAPAGVTESEAANALLDLSAEAMGQAGAQLRWRQGITDTRTLERIQVLRGEEGGALRELAELPLDAAGWADSGLAAGRRYHYQIRYRDRAEQRFQLSEAVELVGGAPTPTPIPPSPTPTPTRTPRPSNTPRPTLTPAPATPTPTATAEASPTPEPGAYLPALLKSAQLR